MSGFDVKGALKEGYTRKEIVDHLAKQNGYDAEAARAEGYTDDAILRHLVGAPQVVEDKENPALWGMVGGGLGLGYGVGDTGIRVAQGSFTKRIEDAAEKSAKKLAETFADDMASRMAANPLVPGSSSGDAVTNWTKQMHSGAHHGGRDFAEAHEIATKLKAAEKADTRVRAVKGSPILLETRTADLVDAERGAAPAVPPKAPPTRTPILQNPAVKIPFKATSLISQVTAPSAGLASSGYGTAQAMNRLQEGTSPRDKAAGALNVLGAASGFGSLAHNPKIKYTSTGISGALNWLANLIATDKNEFEESEQKAAGGAIQGYNTGKKVLAEKAVEGGLDLVKKIFTPKPTKIVRASEALGPHEGKYLYVTESDRMRSTGGDLGGPGFSKFQLEDPRYAEAQAAWGVGKKGKASEILNINKRFPEDKIIWSPLIGSAEQHRSNQHVFDRLTDEFSRQASMGNLPSDLRRGMNDRLANFSGYQKHKLAGIDVANPESIKQFGNTFDRRAAIAEVLGGQGMGGRKGLIFDYPGIMQEMTDPMVVGAPTHSVGTRLFSLTGDVEHRPDLHSAFPYILKGEDKGVAFNAVPKELMLGDWMNQVRDFVGREPGRMDLIRGVRGGHGKPNQFISEEFLRKLEEAGHKEGGLIHLAGGGQPIKMFQQLYRGFAGKPGSEEIFASPQKRVAEYYAQKRAAQTGLQPGVEAVQVDPSAGVKYGHALPIDQFNKDVVTTQARKLSPLDVLNPAPNKMTEAELGMAEYFDNMRKQAQAQRARSAEALRQRAQHYANLQGPQPSGDMGRSVAELADFMESKYK